MAERIENDFHFDLIIIFYRHSLYFHKNPIPDPQQL